MITLLFVLISNYVIFKKAGLEGYRAFIPFYDSYTTCKIGSSRKFFILRVVFCVLAVAALIVGLIGMKPYCNEMFSENGVILLPFNEDCFLVSFCIAAASLIFSLVAWIFYAIAQFYLAKSFGAGKGFSFWIIFFPAVFHGFLAFDKDYQYAGNARKAEKEEKNK